MTDRDKMTTAQWEAVLNAKCPPQSSGPHVSVAEAIYGILWRSGDLNMPYELARKYALEAIGGKGSKAQHRGIEWACAHFPPPDDIDVWQIDDAALPPPPGDAQ